MRFLKQFLAASFVLTLLFGCKPNPLKVNISDIKNDINIVRFDKELFSINSTDTINHIKELRSKYPEFFDLFTYRVIQIGGINDTLFFDGIKRFLSDTLILSIKNIVESEFADFDKIGSELNKSFKYYQYYFPGKELPTIYTTISGFNQSVVTAENIVGISLDKYLGRECSYYRQLSSTPQYKIQNMHKEKIVSDVMYAWGITEFEQSEKATTLLDNMIYYGKLMYFVDAMLPDTEDSLKIGYTKVQLDWCKRNEAQMWSQLIEYKMLYSNKRMDIIRYINNSPTTSGFPLESPGRTGVWIGWQIVRKYMEKFPETKLSVLMKNDDYQQILNDSRYFPE